MIGRCLLPFWARVTRVFLPSSCRPIGQGHFTVPLLCGLVGWAWAMMAILGGVGYGLAEAARKQ